MRGNILGKMYKHMNEGNTHEASVSPTAQTPHRESVAEHGTILLIVIDLVSVNIIYGSGVVTNI